MNPKDFENSIIGIRDLVKQILTLSTGIIAITITFSKDFISIDKISANSQYLISVSWILFLVSIVFGILALMAISGLNIQLIWGKRKVEVYDNNGTYPKEFKSCMLFFASQIIFFLLALVLIVFYGLKLL